MDGWQWFLLSVSGYVAVVTLIRLMRQHRDRLYAELQQQVEREQQRREVDKAPKKSPAQTKQAA